MTLSEFKAWFEGFTESMDGPPSLKQWERIQARVKEISGAPVTERIIHDWWPRERDRPYRAFLSNDRAAYSLNASPSSDGIGRAAFAMRTDPVDENDCRPVDVASVLRALGRADADALKVA